MKSIEEYFKYKVKTRKQLREFIEYEMKIYCDYMYPSKSLLFLGLLRQEPVYKIMLWQRVARIADYYDYVSHTKKDIFSWILYQYYSRLRNIRARRIGLEMTTALIDKGLLVYHYNNVVNSGAIIGQNCHIHGTAVIGNAGPHDLRCPILGHNIMVGAGAIIIGNVSIADNIKIAAGAVVVSSFYESGITIGGVPARKIK